MNRRDWMIGIGALVWATRNAPAADALTPLDEETFQRMVAAHRGKIVLVDFWATWCGPCREEMPKLVGLLSAQKRKEFDLVTISCDEPEQESQASQFVEKQGVPSPHYVKRAKSDDGFINAIDPKWSGALPALFLFDRSGKQVQSFIGETDMKQLEAALDKLAAT